VGQVSKQEKIKPLGHTSKKKTPDMDPAFFMMADSI
jgi:hypothetical protein